MKNLEMYEAEHPQAPPNRTKLNTALKVSDELEVQLLRKQSRDRRLRIQAISKSAHPSVPFTAIDLGKGMKNVTL